MSIARKLSAILLVTLALPAGSFAAAPVPNAGDAPSVQAGAPKLSDFKIIQEHNIFNPNRRARSTNTERRPPPRTVRTENLVLTGVMSYDKGTYAFFDGSSAQYRKVVKSGEGLAGFQVTNVTPQSVQLIAGTNKFRLPVGTQMRREEGGPWRVSGRVEYASSTPPAVSQAPPPTTTVTNSTSAPLEREQFPGAPPEFVMPVPPGGPFSEGEPPPEDAAQHGGANVSPPPSDAGTDNEVLRRLMQRREQELQ